MRARLFAQTRPSPPALALPKNQARNFSELAELVELVEARKTLSERAEVSGAYRSTRNLSELMERVRVE